MKIKRYEASNMQEALNVIKGDLGPEAIILSTRVLKKGGGAMGIFGKPVVEVTAAIEEDRRQEPPGGANGRKRGERERALNEISAPRPDVEPAHLRELRDLRRMVESLIREEEHGRRDDADLSLRKEIAELKEVVDQIRMGGREDGLPIPPSLKGTHRCLISAGMDEVVAGNYIRMLAGEMENGSISGGAAGVEALSELVLGSVKEGGEIRLNPGERKAVALVGPTGVGKTTTAAKLAAEYALKRNKRVGFITLDTYRIAAVEQLKVYAKIIGIPIDVVVTAKEFRERLEANTDKDLILIDTAGRSQRNIKQMAELKWFLEKGGALEVHLLLSSTTKYRDLMDIVTSFSAVPFHKIVFTKLDETTSYGNILSLLSRVDAPLSYFTTGQRVPDDIEVASKRRLKGLFFGSLMRFNENAKALG